MVDGNTAKPHFQRFRLVKYQIEMARDELRRIQRDLSLPVDDVTDALLASAALVQEAASIHELLMGAVYNDERAREQGPREACPRAPSGRDPA